MKRLTEGMCMEILLVQGAVFAQPRIHNYWAGVFALMQKRWPNIIDDLEARYPSVNSADMELLDEFYAWLQKAKGKT